MKNLFMPLVILLNLAALISCVSGEDEEPQLPLEAEIVSDLAAPNDVIDRTTGQVLEENPFQFYSFSENRLMEEGEPWDLAFKGTTIRTNSDQNVKAALIDGVFHEINEVPESANFRMDTDGELAIPTGSGNGWYNYNPGTHTIKPIPGKVILIQTASGNYVKVEILSYYKGNPPAEELDPFTHEGATYTFQFVLQPNGTTNLE